MTNLERLKLETKGITLLDEELNIYLLENGLSPLEEYNPQSETNKRNIYKAALSILESIANNPANMKAYKLDDMTIHDFADSLMARIDQLDRKIRLLKTDDQLANQSNFFMLFTN